MNHDLFPNYCTYDWYIEFLVYKYFSGNINLGKSLSQFINEAENDVDIELEDSNIAEEINEHKSISQQDQEFSQSIFHGNLNDKKYHDDDF